MIADCQSKSVKVKNTKIVLSKGAIAILTVLFDLSVSLLLWFAILMAAPIQTKLKAEI